MSGALICNCGGVCTNCMAELMSRMGGEQGSTPLEVANEQLRARVRAFDALVPRLVAAMREDYCSTCLRQRAGMRERGHCVACDAVLDAEALLGRPS